MIIEQVIGNLKELSPGNRKIDLLLLEWHETAKRILRKCTEGGMDISVKFLKEGQSLHKDDVLYMDDEKMVVVDIIPSDTILVKPRSIEEMGRVCYEIGNKHLPLFIQNEEILLPYEEPIFNWLNASGYNIGRENLKLVNMLKTNVLSHNHARGGESLFSKIMGMGR